MRAEYRFDGCNSGFEIAVARISMEISFFTDVPAADFLTNRIAAKAIDPRFLLFCSACKSLQQELRKIVLTTRCAHYLVLAESLKGTDNGRNAWSALSS